MSQNYNPLDHDSVVIHISGLEAEIERLRAVVKDAGDVLEKLAFEMPPPNQYTPRLVMLANAIRAALEPKP